MRKIAFYINTLGIGGAERVMTNLCNNLADAGNDVLLIDSFPSETEYPLNAAVRRIDLESVKDERGVLARNLSRIRKLRAVIKREKPELLVSFMAEPNFRALAASIGLRVKNVISVRNDPKKEYAGTLGSLIAKFILPWADGCVFQTEEARAWFPKSLQKKSTVIMNAVDARFFAVQREENDEGNPIVACGRLTEQKNYPMMIEAFEKVKKSYPAETLRIYGEGAKREELSRLIEEKHLEDSVKLCGISRDVPAILQKAKIFLMSSDYEGMPNALLEALAAGVPCVSTDCPCGGPKTVIQSGENGVLVPVGGAAETAKAICDLLADAEKRRTVAANAKASAEEFTTAKIDRKWREYLYSFLKVV